MDRTKIIELLEAETKYLGLKLPSYISFHIQDRRLILSLGSHLSKVGEEVFSCVANMQKDEAAFESWSICIKHHLRDYFDQVILSWIKPNPITQSQQLHYNRFCYRIIRFRQMFDWFDVAEINKQEIIEFEAQLTDLTINNPLNEASEVSNNSQIEKQIEYNQQNLACIKDKFQLQCINHQLPVGVKNGNVSFFTGRGSAIDIWGIDQENNLDIFELKYNNKKVGIITELLFYSEVMYDLFVSKKIGTPQIINPIRNAEFLYGNNAINIKGIKSFFLFDKLHPVVVGTTALLNTNNFGIEFFNIQYKLKKETFLIERLYYKGAYQMEEEIRQTSFRKLNGLNGYSYLLNNGDENLHESIREQAIRYFKEHNIDWWTFDNSSFKATKHLVSSQIQCLNYLFALRKDKEATLKLAQLFDPNIDDVFPTVLDKDSGYIAFEFIYENAKLLNENNWGAKRGSNCTSIDAFIIAKRNGKKVLIPIEWKYTENYFDSFNKALEEGKGIKRQKSYNNLIAKSNQLKFPSVLEESIYYYEPFYELMRQTLLVEQMMASNIADDFLHIIVVPSKNKDFLENCNSTSVDLKSIWSSCLKDSRKFKVIDNKQILKIIKAIPTYTKLADYLNIRY